MCESVVYVREGNSEKLYARDIATMMFEEGGVVLIDIAGNKYVLTNVVLEYIDFIGHRAVLKKLN
ncbi:MAG: CooT family nickel-binding protein [Desulfurococcaceae archaeon]